MSQHIPSCAAAVPVFRMLPDSQLLKLGEAMEHRHFHKGDIVASAGSPLDHLIVVAHGRLNIVHTTVAGREQVVRSLGPGEFLGEMALFYETKLDGDVIAAEDSAACLLPRKAVQEVLQHPPAALKLVEEMAKRLASAEQLIADLGLKEVGQRLAAELVRLMEPAGVPPDVSAGAMAGGPTAAKADVPADTPADTPADATIRSAHNQILVTVPVPWSHLASKLGTTPETLSRRLGSLADQGVIRQLGGRKLVILDPDRLRTIAEG